jgi:capsular polysaccharide transport system ATP-binding protein
MITISNLSKIYSTRYGKKCVLNNINLTIEPSEKVALIGANGSGKSTLIRLIGGLEKPTTGKILRNMKVSWPIGLIGGLQPTITGIDNIKFICRIYDKDLGEKISFVKEFTELGSFLYEPVAHYSTGMRTKLAIALSLLVEFDCYLVDEALAVLDAKHEKKYSELMEERKSKSLILASHSEKQIRERCDTFCVIDSDGNLKKFVHPNPAFEYYKSIKKINLS